ncbi:DeoR/GlpR family DNA-binding transcription regulator [Comamonas sp. JNW]|uniref:DeoR/GlpR family DNA-binding transcription regulator n=1 Tax=Comamonas sp. JNW TaxID=2170731 RepID=UPI000DE6EBCC|nr:DeoR/GlpR family DNA-binding transcription regulator [Comamonas sp. JNW]PWB16586.1 DeoR family transcriptional regulator [Comamonas sp. JNW]
MKVANRRESILHAVHSGMTDVAALCARFAISEATVRRDLQALQQDGRLLRVYGGAVAAPIRHEPEESLELRKVHDGEAKAAIARKAISLIEPGDTIFIDGGTTTDALARLLPKDDSLRIITNNLLALNTLSSRDIPVTLLGGDLRRGSMSVYGSLADMALERLTFDKVFCSADGIDAEFGVCEGSIEQAWFKEKLFRRTREVYLLATAEKLGRKSQMNWSPIHRQWTLITDAAPESHAVQAFGNHPFVTVVPVA